MLPTIASFSHHRPENLLLGEFVRSCRDLAASLCLQGITTVPPILPDKENVFEAGAQQMLSKFVRLNVTLYQKRIENFSDKDQFFETGVIFPVAISAGRVTGEELRLESTEIYGFRGFASYANAYALRRHTNQWRVIPRR